MKTMRAVILWYLTSAMALQKKAVRGKAGSIKETEWTFWESVILWGKKIDLEIFWERSTVRLEDGRTSPSAFS
jgi:hypothetical protein